MSAGVITRGGHCLKVRTKKQHVVSQSSSESELYAAAKPHHKPWGSRVWQRTRGQLVAEPTSACLSDNVPGQSQRHEHHGLRVHENREKRVEVSIEHMIALQIAVLAVGYVRWIGGIKVPVTDSWKCKFCKRT